MRLAVSTELVLEELQSAASVLTRWSGALARGIPGVDLPGSAEVRAEYVRQFCGELQVVANKCQSLAVVLAADGDANDR